VKSHSWGKSKRKAAVTRKYFRTAAAGKGKRLVFFALAATDTPGWAVGPGRLFIEDGFFALVSAGSRGLSSLYFNLSKNKRALRLVVSCENLQRDDANKYLITSAPAKPF
jgi:hypothetical protein